MQFYCEVAMNIYNKDWKEIKCIRNQKSIKEGRKEKLILQSNPGFFPPEIPSRYPRHSVILYVPNMFYLHKTQSNTNIKY